MGKSGKHFVLVHGACHGAWCWYKLATLLETAGHKVTALDLAASGINPKQPSDIQSLSDYFEPLLSFMEALPPEEKVVLVGHSRGGIAISVAMEKFPKKISVAVFIAAYMPGPNFTIRDIHDKNIQVLGSSMDCKFTFDSENCLISFVFGPNFLATKFYQLSPPEDLSLAKLLARPYRYCDDERSLKDTSLTKENYGSVHRVYLMISQDKAVTEDIQKWIVQNNPPDEAKEIFDSDHMVMLSKPQELFSILQDIAKKHY